MEETWHADDLGALALLSGNLSMSETPDFDS